MDTRAFSRKLRAEQSDGEARLWTQLRGRRFLELKFKRQVPVGPYFADFLCESEKLIVEVDGWQHNEQMAYDAERDDYLAELRYRVVRVDSHQVHSDLAQVLYDLKQFVGDEIKADDKHGGEGVHFPSSALRAPSPEGEG